MLVGAGIGAGGARQFLSNHGASGPRVFLTQWWGERRPLAGSGNPTAPSASLPNEVKSLRTPTQNEEMFSMHNSGLFILSGRLIEGTAGLPDSANGWHFPSH